MAHKKAGGSATSGKTSQSKRLGVKLFDGQVVKPGMIIVRQKSSMFYPGEGVLQGKDKTLFAVKNGYIHFSSKKVKNFTGKLKKRQFITIIPEKKKSK
jgi:large subunit ribosomal protein L27